MSDTAVPEAVQSQAPLRRGIEFRDPTTLTRTVVVLLVLDAIVQSLGVVSSGYAYALLANYTVLGDTAVALDAVVAIAQAILNFATGCFFLSWIYRANRNARALGATGMRFSPGWAVGWYFVPIANLWKPYQAMREIWQASVDPGAWQNAATSPLLGWWWALWLTSQITFKFTTTNGPSFDTSRSAAFQLITGVAGVALDLVALVLLRRIAALQLWQSKIADVF